MYKLFLSSIISVFLVTSIFLFSNQSWSETKLIPLGVSPIIATDYIHSVIEADRTIYSKMIVERLGDAISLKATENYLEENTLPLPAQFLLLASQNVASTGLGMTYRLMSLWPINPQNGPNDDFEKKGLEEVRKNPNKPFTTTFTSNGKRMFKAVYPDKAVSKSCATCHNAHSKSPKKDFTMGGVMGGISITIPLEQGDVVPAKAVADYIYAVLESDRMIYAEFVVNRLQNNKIAYATEHWWKDKSLLLPAQFLKNASDLIAHKRMGLMYKLFSLWPINQYNRAVTEFEKKGAEVVAKNPNETFVGTYEVHNRQFFETVYPDLAISNACVSCHNTHPNSPRRDFKRNEVMGGIMVSFPVQ
jgi:cytochrome c553